MGNSPKLAQPRIHAPEDLAEGTFSVHADNVERAEKIATNLKKKYEKMGAKVETLEPTNNPEMVSGEIEQGLSIGGEHANKSHVKTALAYADLCGLSVNKCDIALSFVKGTDIDCIGLWYAQDLVVDREDRDVFHCVSVWGDPDSGRLLAYVEHYGAMRYLICLSNTYVHGHNNPGETGCFFSKREMEKRAGPLIG